MEQKQIVGIDVSKKTLDICIKPAGTTFQISNDLAGFKQFRKQIGSTVLVIMEHTGSYSLRLERFLTKHAIDYCKISALEIKKSMGLVRGKSDKVDAYRIAEYGWLRREQLVADPVVSEGLIKLQNLLSLRSKLVKDRSGYMSRLKEMKASKACVKKDLEYQVQMKVIQFLSTQIKTIESQIEVTIEQDPTLEQTSTLLQSIKGVGKIIAAHMICSTKNFKKFRNARKFNCYAGLAPFKHESGSSIRGRSRVSHLANKEIKTLLNLSAFCAIRTNQELKTYYQKRVAEGKQKMACINIIRSKIVARMFAIIKRQTPYQNLPLAA